MDLDEFSHFPNDIISHLRLFCFYNLILFIDDHSKPSLLQISRLQETSESRYQLLNRVTQEKFIEDAARIHLLARHA